MNPTYKYQPGQHRVNAIYSTDIEEDGKNPLIAALQPTWSTEQIAGALSFWPKHEPACHAWSPDKRLTWAAKLVRGFETMPQHVEILKGVLNQMQECYVGRDRYVHGHTEQIRENAARMMDCEDSGVDMGSASNSLLIHGLPGLGKTKLMQRIGALVPQVIDHVAFGDRRFPCRQVTHLYVAAQQGWTDKALAQAIVLEFDRVAGTNHSAELLKNRSSSAFSYLMQFSLSANNHGLGVLIIDEVQSLRDNASLLNFIFNFSITNKVLLVLVGTPESVEVLQQSPRFMRRGETTFDTELKPYSFPKVDKEAYHAMLQGASAPDPWTWFLLSFWHRQFMSQSTALTYELSSTLFDQCVGIPNYAVKIFVAAQQARIGSNRDYLDVDALKEGYRIACRLSAPYLEALRNGEVLKLRQYADFAGTSLEEIAGANAAKAKAQKTKDQNSQPPAPPVPKQQPRSKGEAKAKPDPVNVEELQRAAGNDFL